MKQPCLPMKHYSSSGFNLVEMAMVLLILGLLLGGLLTAIGTSTDSVRRTNADTEMRQIEEALYGFAQANGRLPCPATDTSDGVEEFTGPPANGACTAFHGLVPTVTLGLFGDVNEDRLLLDPWGNPYRYSVTDETTIAGDRAVTTVAGMSDLFNLNELNTPTPMTLLRVCEDVTDCDNSIIVNTAPALIISMGENWATFTSADELENAGDTATFAGYPIPDDNDFVDTEYNEDNFDDQLRWLSPHILFSRLVQAGRLP